MTVASSLNIRLRADIDNYCVMGNPVAHSKSPQIHQAFARQCAHRLDYQSILVEPGFFSEALAEFHRQGGKGLNITVPFKADARAAVVHCTQRAARAGAVNTIWFDGQGKSHGDTTDGAGLIRDLNRNAFHLPGKRVLLLGAGGAVRSVLAPLLEQGVASLTLANRALSRAKVLADSFSTAGDIQVCAYQDLRAGSADIIINGTSASLHGELPPLAPGLVANACCYDMVYADMDTVFVSWSKANGAAKAMDGLGMLVEQAAESYYIWRGVRPDTMPVIAALRRKQ